jgi:uncharacterized protein (TIGR02145 family)
MAENLNYGTPVLGLSSDANQSNETIVEKYCYGDDNAKCDTDGGLYQWAEAMALPSFCNTTSCADSVNTKRQGICPSKWHMPSIADWDTLATFLGTADSAGSKMKFAGTGFPDWNVPNYNQGNPFEFTALPTGLRLDGGGFYGQGSLAIFWEAKENNVYGAGDRNLDVNDPKLYASTDIKRSGLSVRCIMDAQ